MIRYHWANTLLGVSLSNDKQLRTQNFYNIDPKWILAKKVLCETKSENVSKIRVFKKVFTKLRTCTYI